LEGEFGGEAVVDAHGGGGAEGGEEAAAEEDGLEVVGACGGSGVSK